MNEYIKLLAEIDLFGLLIALGIVVLTVVTGRDLLEKFCDAIGIEFSWVRKKRELDAYRLKVKDDLETLQERQTKFEEEHKQNIAARDKFNKDVIENIEQIRNDMKALSEDIDRGRAEDRFKKLKYYVISSANRIIRKEIVSEELVRRIYEDIREYHDLQQKYGFENDQATASIAVFTEKYKEMLKTGHMTQVEE